MSLDATARVVGPEEWSDLLTNIRSDCYASKERKVLVFVPATSADSVAAAKILEVRPPLIYALCCCLSMTVDISIGHLMHTSNMVSWVWQLCIRLMRFLCDRLQIVLKDIRIGYSIYPVTRYDQVQEECARELADDFGVRSHVPCHV